MLNRSHIFYVLFACTALAAYSQDTTRPDRFLKNLLIDNRYGEVLRLADSLETPDSLKGHVNFYRGLAFQSLYKYDSARHYYEQALLYDSSNLSYRFALGQVLRRLGRTAKSMDVYEGICSEEPTVQPYTELAALYSLAGKHKKSLDIYKRLLERDSLNYYYLKQAGKTCQEMNLPDSALHYFKRAFRQNPQDIFLTHQIASIYLKKRELEEAILSIQDGIVYDTCSLELLKLRGYIWLLAGEYYPAVTDLEKARMQDTASVFINKYLGISHHEVKLFHESRQSLLNAYKGDSLDAETAFFLGSACRWSGYEEEGVKYYIKSLELRQPDPQDMKDTHLHLAELLKVLHRFDEALASYHAALEYDPSDNVIWFKIGQLYDRNLNQKETAIKYYEKYLNDGQTGQQLFNSQEGRSTDLEEHVKQRIAILKEDLFFEGQ